MREIREPLVNRERILLKNKLNEKLTDETIKTIGIIYGAAHGPGIRGTIENLGFKEIKTLMLKAF